RFAEVHLGAVEQYLKKGKTQDARRAFDLAVREGTSASPRQPLESQLKRAEVAEAKKQAKVEAAAGALARQAYAKALRDRYLDQNLDIMRFRLLCGLKMETWDRD